jgi:mono/diheme cytochrome c family protein
MRPLILTLAALIGLLAGGPSRAGQESPRAANSLVSAGREFALEVCAACHVVGKAQTTAPILNPPAPNFLVIAKRAKTTETFLRAFLRAPHGKMPDPELADFQIDEVVAYILSLKRGR